MHRLRELNDCSDLTIQPWLYLNPVRLLNGDVRFRDLRDIRLRKLSNRRMMQYLLRSRCSLDIQFKHQSGITTRAIEALPAKTKILTNNENIKLYDFYRPENIMIIDPSRPKIDKAWLREPFADVDEDILRRYSITAWVEEVFDV